MAWKGSNARPRRQRLESDKLTVEGQKTANAVLKFLHVVLKLLLYLSEQTWLRATALILLGFVAGLWLDWLLRKLDGSRAEERQALGTEMVSLGDYLRFSQLPTYQA